MTNTTNSFPTSDARDRAFAAFMFGYMTLLCAFLAIGGFVVGETVAASAIAAMTVVLAAVTGWLCLSGR